MIKQLFPLKHVLGYVISLILTIIALSVAFYDISFTAGMVILSITAIIQTTVQLFMFMHVNESKDKRTIYLSIIYALFVAHAVIFGTILTMIWGHAH
jgi:cytochrome aa3-600 menaquinol oxidase subunit 4